MKSQTLLDIIDFLEYPAILVKNDGNFLKLNRTAKQDKTDIYHEIVDSYKRYQKRTATKYFEEVEVERKKFFVKAYDISNDSYILVVLPSCLFPSIQESVNRTKEMVDDLNAIFESSWDIIYVVSADGKTLRVSSACEKILGLPPDFFINRSVYELEKEKYFYPSISKLVIKRKEKVSGIQMTNNGKRLFTIGIPVFDDEGNLVRVIDTARDITELTKLQQEIEFYKNNIEIYEQELSRLKEKHTPYAQRSKEMERVYDIAIKIANVSSTVLITGETGVGKSSLARYIHEKSNRSSGPFITVPCGSIPETLLESELFGYERGAFTGANKEGKKGMVELAEGGTLFLDEIGELSLALQVKLLHLIQNKTYRRVGSVRDRQADIRIIAATNQDLEKMIEEKKFRQDLYYRLSVIPIHILPLRKRKEDIVPLIYTFLKRFNELYGCHKSISTKAVDVLTEYDWPGNIREIENIIERLVVTVEDDYITVDHLPSHLLKQYKEPILLKDDNTIQPLRDVLEKTEKAYLSKVASKFKNTLDMAKALEVHQSTISRKLNKYGIKL